MTKSEQKQIARATNAGGLGTLLHTFAIIHRAGSARTQKEINLIIEKYNAWDQFTMRNGALLYRTEV